MPFFKWIGTFENTMSKGKLFARSYEHAHQKIGQQGVTVIMMHPYKPLLYKKASLEEKVMFMSQLSDLLTAGIRLSDALVIARASIKNSYFLLHIDDCLHAVTQGIPLYHACSFYTHIFDPLTCALLQAGHETGNLAGATKRIVDYLQGQQIFKERMRSALLMPFITGIFFIAVAFFIFVMIVPRFETLLLTSRVPLPLLTRTVLFMSQRIRSLLTIKNSLFIMLGGIFIIFLLSKTRCKYIYEKMLVKTPFLGKLVYEKTLARFLMVTGILVAERVPLVHALEHAQKTTAHSLFYTTFERLKAAVQAGKPLSAAFSEEPLVHNQQMESLMQVGEATGTLDKLLLQGAQLLQKSVEKTLESLTTFIQPALLIILGLLIGMLIVAVYVPLLSLTSSLGTNF